MCMLLQLKIKLKEKFLTSQIPVAMLVPLELNLSINCASGRQCQFRGLCIIHESKGGGQGGPLQGAAGPADCRVPFGRAGLDGGGADSGLESDVDQAGGIMRKCRLPRAGPWL